MGPTSHGVPTGQEHLDVAAIRKNEIAPRSLGKQLDSIGESAPSE